MQHMEQPVYCEVAQYSEWPMIWWFCEGLDRLSVLPLTYAEVAIRNWGQPEEGAQWTESDMKATAKRIEEALLV